MSDQPCPMLAELGHFGDSLIRDAPDAIVYADEAGVIRFWNRGAERIFGFAAAEAIGQSLDIIIPETLRARHWEGYDRVMRTGVSRYSSGDVLAVPGLRKDGSRISLEFTVVPLRDDEGRMRGIAAIPARRYQAVRRDKGASKATCCGQARVMILQPLQSNSARCYVVVPTIHRSLLSAGRQRSESDDH